MTTFATFIASWDQASSLGQRIYKSSTSSVEIAPPVAQPVEMNVQLAKSLECNIEKSLVVEVIQVESDQKLE